MIIKDNNKKRKAPYIIIGLLILLFFFSGVFVYVTGAISKLFFPIQRSIYQAGVYIKELGTSIVDYKQILEENKNLRNENAKVEMLSEFNKNLVVENLRLKELLNMKETSNSVLKVAKVNFRSPNNLYERFYIDLGEKDGIQKDMMVFVEKNLIGKIREVFPDYAIVDMITGENYSISAMTEGEMLGRVKGSDEETGVLYFEPNTFQKSIRQGEKVYTSGISEIYPKGLYIGKIEEVDQDENEIFRSIKVKSDVDMLNINEVLIMFPETAPIAKVPEKVPAAKSTENKK